MSDLKEQESRILQQFLEDPNGRNGLKAFFAEQVKVFEEKSQSHMRQYNMPMAQECACFANAYRNGFSRLEDFSREQSKRFD